MDKYNIWIVDEIDMTPLQVCCPWGKFLTETQSGIYTRWSSWHERLGCHAPMATSQSLAVFWTLGTRASRMGFSLGTTGGAVCPRYCTATAIFVCQWFSIDFCRGPYTLPGSLAVAATTAVLGDRPGSYCGSCWRNPQWIAKFQAFTSRQTQVLTSITCLNVGPACFLLTCWNIWCCVYHLLCSHQYI